MINGNTEKQEEQGENEIACSKEKEGMDEND